MIARNYSEVDVFSPTTYRGNPLAVVHDARGLDSDQMQRFAKWTNLAETTFLLPPSDPAADYRVRIFSATHELPFAGHPTLGSAAAWLGAGGVPRREGYLVQECGAGLVTVRVKDGRFAFAAPPLTRYERADEPLIHEIARALSIPRELILDASWIVNGPEWIGIRLASAAEVLALAPDPANLGSLCIGVVGPHEPGHEVDFEVRAFVGGDPVWEDPVTGSLNAGLARWLMDTGVAGTNYIAAQGTAIGYEGRVHVSVEAEDIWVAGEVTHCVNGQVTL
ncbi:PhzF family phenazine biosynthesis protein [Glutamicibacter sp. PS]|uniref:PhzF family phenazine biosynthesis protein n=1 Tax=Glutamicibacter sp. PS TaxID=3075634 RepID=UPI002840EC28|nr:PhzF family phenazine biosynthesis protein [Glutamicibacter sp. PS]MDR4533087.1 PhzF family phenazine biosynthesis protein [Glutamicibacter sp. PS]